VLQVQMAPIAGQLMRSGEELKRALMEA